MNRILFLLYWLIVPLVAAAQSNPYEIIKKKGVMKSLQYGNFRQAKKQLDLLAPYVNDANSKDYEQLLVVIQDSIEKSYTKACDLQKDGQYALAIEEYRKLIDENDTPFIKPLFANIGYCFELNANASKDSVLYYYKQGVKCDEELSALRLAKFIRKNKIEASSEDVISLYLKSSSYNESKDSLGCEYAKLKQINNAYKWLKKSESNYSKYLRALFILSNIDELSEEYKTEDPIKLLTEASDDNYAPAQLVLGQLYYASDNSLVQKDRTKGLTLIQRAAQEYTPAKKVLREINAQNTVGTKGHRGSYVTWDDFVYAFTPEGNTLGIGYEYSQYFPVTCASYNTTSIISWGVKLGVNVDKKRFQEAQYNPLCFLTWHPGLYFRFVSLNCGLGMLFSHYNKIIDGYGNTKRKTKVHFSVKPSITGYIPICDEEYYITINAGYNYFHKFKELNGWTVGVGFQFVL